VNRLAEQSGRLADGNYPVRFTYRSLFSDMDANRHLNNGTIGRLFEEGRVRPVPLTDAERDLLARLAFNARDGSG
jgi:hypothetical protein